MLTPASLTITLVVVDLTAVTVALPVIQADLGAGPAEVQWVVDAYAITLAAMLLPLGVLADRYGRRRMLAIGVTLFTLASLACALAPNAILLDQVALTAPADRLGMATGIVNALKQVGTAIGVAVLALPYGAGVRTMLLVAAALAAAGALLPLGLLHGRRPAVAGRPTV
ncbi:Major Facilitator Superfamily protein [Streptosporangium subroseum]|uniref:Major Facilitator Superfamily protein n=1 Tax=Streptosporangium subroseum TaxID=106412 RepID=A0A239MKZ8_9ACTN|nr:Major Facilitator Superfamily protein [Streptosporangium subroseum]